MPTNVAGFAEARPLEGYVKPSTVNAACDQVDRTKPEPPSRSLQAALVRAIIRFFFIQYRREYMAVVQGIREKVHLPLYDCVTVEGGSSSAMWRSPAR